MKTKPLYDVFEVAEILGYTPEHVRRLIRNGTIKARRIGERGQYRVTRKDLEKFFLSTYDVVLKGGF